jgi:hypothetical protein
MTLTLGGANRAIPLINSYIPFSHCVGTNRTIPFVRENPPFSHCGGANPVTVCLWLIHGRTHIPEHCRELRGDKARVRRGSYRLRRVPG